MAYSLAAQEHSGPLAMCPPHPISAPMVSINVLIQLHLIKKE